MKQLGFLVLFSLVMVLFLPIIVFFVMNLISNNENAPLKNTSSEEISVYFHNENVVKTVNLEDYLCGVVSAEMPASFEIEALKAQAVAARSYALYRKNNSSNPDHPSAAVCTDFNHCKAYLTDKEKEEKWGDDTQKYSKKINSAVFSTRGEIITYNGDAVLAVFHSQSGGGRTENSSDVWGGNIPYLVSVESHGEEAAPNFYSSATFSFDDFKKTLQKNVPDILLDSISDIGETKKSEGGSVSNISIGNKEISGKDMRTYFKLRSSCFEIKKSDESVTFEVMGYGHGVGMSQYGANQMAKEGFDYKNILTHYYTGTKIEGV